MQINHKRLTEAEEKAVEIAAEKVYDVLMQEACAVGIGIAYARFQRAGAEQTDEESDYISDVQMMMANRMMALMLKRSTEI